MQLNWQRPKDLTNWERPSELVEINGESLTMKQIAQLSAGARIKVSDKTIKKLKAARQVVDRIVASGVPTYGINTGFGLLSNKNIPPHELEDLQLNIIRSHASGVGEPLQATTVRRIMALRINTLARGQSGMSLQTFDQLVTLFNSGCTPLVPSQGTVGASGDLAPLAHIGLALIGNSKLYFISHL